MLRWCRKCGLEAHTEDDLDLFKKEKRKPYGRDTLCKACDSRRVTERQKARGEAYLKYHRSYYKRNRDRQLQWQKDYYQKNRAAVDAHSAVRRARKLNATPAWQTNEVKRIQVLYATAQAMGLHVDHIVPLNNDLVCGLHCLANLQLLTPSDNMRKSNSFRP